MAVQSLQDAIGVLNECDVRIFGRIDKNGKARATVIATSPKNQKAYFIDRKQQPNENGEAKWQFVLGKELQPKADTVDA